MVDRIHTGRSQDGVLWGPITTSRNKGSVKWHRIAVKDVASGKMALHHFVLDDEPKVEDTDIKEMVNVLQ